MKKNFRGKSFLDIPTTKELAIFSGVWCLAIALVSYGSYESGSSISVEKEGYALSLFIIYTLMLIKMHFNYWNHRRDLKSGNTVNSNLSETSKLIEHPSRKQLIIYTSLWIVFAICFIFVLTDYFSQSPELFGPILFLILFWKITNSLIRMHSNFWKHQKKL